jgi:Protein of unknown function (DUF4254)
MRKLPDIPALQDEFSARWHHQEALPTSYSGLERLVLEQHLKNFQLWHEEDQARAPYAPAETIARVKRNIDAFNQRRNDLMEEIDRELMRQLAASSNNSAVLHSETPGMMIDRLSILSLKLYHTREELDRLDASPAHRARNQERLKILEEQRNDLAENLEQLWDDLSSGRRRFKVYRQLKMYNDPELNPEIYRRKS